MDSLVQVIKDFFIPGSSTFLIIAAAIGVVLLQLNQKWRKWGRIWLTSLIVFYWIIATPLGATLLEAGLSGRYAPIESAAETEGAEAIVILGGGSINLRARGEVFSLLISASALRGMEGIRLEAMMEEPSIIVSGGSNPFLGGGTPESTLLLDILLDAGIPRERIILETASQSTREQASYLKAMLADLGIDKFILVTSPIHMPRSMAVFQAYGMKPIPGPSAPRSEGLDGGIPIFPSWLALDASQAAMREYMAVGYYWVRGWLSTQ